MTSDKHFYCKFSDLADHLDLYLYVIPNAYYIPQNLKLYNNNNDHNEQKYKNLFSSGGGSISSSSIPTISFLPSPNVFSFHAPTLKIQQQMSSDYFIMNIKAINKERVTHANS